MKKLNIDSIKKNKNEFKIPENYFDNFEGELLSKWNTNHKPQENKVFRINKYMYIYIAASIILFLGLFFIIKDKNTNGNIENIEIENYLYTQSLIFYPEMIEDLDNEDFKTLEIGLILEKKQIDEYLLDNTDIEYLIED